MSAGGNGNKLRVWGQAGRNTYLVNLGVEYGPKVEAYVIEHNLSNPSEALLELVLLGLGSQISLVEDQRIQMAVREEVKRINKKIKDLLWRTLRDENQDQSLLLED